MEGNLTFRRFLLLLFNLVLGSFGQVFLKKGLPTELTTVLSILRAMIHPYVLLGLGLYVLSVFTWLLLLSKVRLSVAYPMISISYFFVVALAAFYLDEPVNWAYAATGLGSISIGVMFIGIGLGGPGSSR